MKRFAWLIMAVVLCAGLARAELKVAHLFGSHMVLQRNLAVPIWGWANPGEQVAVTFAGQEKTVTADKAGKWMVPLRPMKANAKGQTLTVRSLMTKKKIECSDVLVGDVWLCAGQSNMDYEVAGGRRGKRKLLAKFDAKADYPAIRHFAVPEKSAAAPLADLSKTPGWKPCSPKTVGAFSAVGYFFGRMLHEQTNVPIGLITSAVGGTKIDCWARAAELGKVKGCQEKVATVVERAKLLKTGTFRMEHAMDIWATKHDPSSAEKKGWVGPTQNVAGWKTIRLPSRWSETKIDELKPFKGLVWFQRTVDIPARLAGKDMVVSLGKIDDRDTAFFNGVRIGGGVQHDQRRLYKVPGNRVTAGKAVIAIRVWNGWGDGGVWGEPKQMSLYPAGQKDQAISLAGQWHYKLGLPASKMPTAPMRMGVRSRENLATGLYNGMIAPLVPYAIRGAIWYQGESNGDEGISYMHKTRALVEGWRNAWGQGDFPFYFVQLANFQDPGETPEGGDGWAKIRMAQLKALEIKNTGMAVAIELADAGNPKDVHPENKKDVGERLALWALAKDYGKAITCSGPLYKSMAVKGRDAIIRFDYVGKGLMVGEKVGLATAKEVAGGQLKRFAISGADGQWHVADAKIVGDTVVVSSKAVAKPVAVRYAYTMNPAGCNLYNKAGLPASPFTTDTHWHGEVGNAPANASAEPPKATLSLAQIKQLKAGLYEVPNSQGLLLTRIKPGQFIMGSPAKEVGRGPHETQRPVAITKPFYMGIVEVTQAQYLNAMFPNHTEYCQNKGPWGHTLPSFAHGGPWGVDRSAGIHAGLESDHPMDMLTWKEATQFAAWLNKREAAAGRLPQGYVYRLPTEAEWEYACRAGTKGPFGTQGEIEEFFGFSLEDFDGNVQAPFGRRKPNAWGLYDMHGSLYEWVEDWHGPYDKTQKTDPTGLSAGKEKVVRGGSYISYKEKDDGVVTTPAQRMRTIRSASRNHFPADYSLPITGMRIVLGPVLTPAKETE